MTDDLVERLQLEAMCSDYHVDELNEAADEILRLRKQIAVMEVEKSLAAACLPSGYVRQTFKTGTGDFAKGVNDD